MINTISTPLDLLIAISIILAFLMALFRFANWLESLPVKDPKKDSSKTVKTKTLEKTIEVATDKVKENSNNIVNESKLNDNSTELSSTSSNAKISSTASNSNKYSNYLYDRFVENPSVEDEIKINKVSESFLSDKEMKDIRNRKVDIKVNDVVDIDKDRLYKKIETMASENVETKEKLLQEFESLPKEMKLLLIENIMQKM